MCMRHIANDVVVSSDLVVRSTGPIRVIGIMTGQEAASPNYASYSILIDDVSSCPSGRLRILNFFFVCLHTTLDPLH
jgi:hypothetical protein